jgi:hypothetical protein
MVRSTFQRVKDGVPTCSPSGQGKACGPECHTIWVAEAIAQRHPGATLNEPAKWS